MLIAAGAGLRLSAGEFPAPPVPPRIPDHTFPVNRYGAVGDGVTTNTAAIQAAIDAASHAGGGVVEVPAGVFLSGPLRLADEV
ncbi:MAG TPA: glycosyl hydrolase family 28-related protein, partial [Candidatus Binatia bacterium]|nr:glycosyl hydrolase family 28-related protein [Candidatus Binatia bacterium]